MLQIGSIKKKFTFKNFKPSEQYTQTLLHEAIESENKKKRG
jgi:hypothetical protein